MNNGIALSEICTIGSGGTPSRSNSEFYGGTIPWAKISDMPADGVVTDTEEHISEAGLNAIRGRLFPQGTLLFAIYGSMGKMAFAGRDIAVNQAILGIQAKRPKTVCLRYLFHYLGSRVSELVSDGRGVTQKNLSATYLRNLRVNLPNYDEQHRISAILDKADAIRRKRERALTLTGDFLRSAYLHIVGMKHPNFESWELAAIETLATNRRGSIRSGPFGSALLHSEFVEKGIAVLGIDNAVKNKFQWAARRFITPAKYQELRRYRVYPNDVIITIMGTTGRSAVVPTDIPEAITTKHLASITCDRKKVVPEFLSFAIHSDPLVIEQIRTENKGAIMDGLNLGIIRRLRIRMPPMSQQLLFAGLLKRTYETIGKMTTPMGDGSDLFASLSQRAFRGEL